MKVKATIFAILTLGSGISAASVSVEPLDIEVTYTAHTDWMSGMMDVIGNKTLMDVTLPGTHDSGAYELSSEIVPGEIPSWAEDIYDIAEKLHIPADEILNTWGKAQDLSLYDQLCAGARYIDFRSGWDASTSTWKTFHGSFGNPVQILLTDIARFLNEHTGEVVVVEVSHFVGSPGSDDMSALADMIVQTLGGLLYRTDAPTPVLKATVSEIVSSGARAIVSLGNSVQGSYPQLWPGSLCHNSYANSADKEKMEAYNWDEAARIAGPSYPSQLAKLSWTLTPDTSAVLEMVLFWKPHSLIGLADTAADELAVFATRVSSATDARALGQLVLVDHIEATPVVEVAVAASGGSSVALEGILAASRKVTVVMGVEKRGEALVTVVKERHEH